MRTLINAFLCFSGIISLFSCLKDDVANPSLTRIYNGMMDSLVFNCVTNNSTNLLTLKMDGKDVCYYEGINDRTLNFSVGSKFTTSSPSFSNGQIRDARMGASLNISHQPMQNREHFIYLEFPDYNIGVDTLQYLDSLFAINENEIIGSEDIIVPSNFSDEEAYALKYNGGFLKKFKVNFKIPHINPGATGGLVLESSSLFGPQEDSYLKFAKVEKTREKDGTYYKLEIDFRCKLYHHPQNGRSGLFKEITEGKYIVKIHATRR